MGRQTWLFPSHGQAAITTTNRPTAAFSVHVVAIISTRCSGDAHRDRRSALLRRSKQSERTTLQRGSSSAAPADGGKNGAAPASEKSNFYRTAQILSSRFDQSKQSEKWGKEIDDQRPAGTSADRQARRSSRNSGSTRSRNRNGFLEIKEESHFHRWVGEVATKVISILEQLDDPMAVDASVTARVMEVMPPPSPLKDDIIFTSIAANGSDVGDSGIEEGDAGSSGDDVDLFDDASAASDTASSGEDDQEADQFDSCKAVEASSELGLAPRSYEQIYGGELGAIMQFYNQQQQQEGFVGVTDSLIVQDKGHIEQPASRVYPSARAPWTPYINENSLTLLLRLVSEAAGPRVALTLFHILTTYSLTGDCNSLSDTIQPQNISIYPTHTSRVLGAMMHLLWKDGMPKEAHDVMFGALQSDGGYQSRQGRWAHAWASLGKAGRPDLVALLIENVTSAGIDPGIDAFGCQVQAYEVVGDATGAVAALRAIRARGHQPALSAIAAVGRAAVAVRNIPLVYKALDWGELEAGSDECEVWREVLGACIRSGTSSASNLQNDILDRMEAAKRRLSCNDVRILVTKTAGKQMTVAMLDFFRVIRQRCMIRGIPVPSTSGAQVRAPGMSDEAMEMYAALVTASHRWRLNARTMELVSFLKKDRVAPDGETIMKMSACIAQMEDGSAALALYDYVFALRVEMSHIFYRNIIATLISNRNLKAYWGKAMLLTHRMHIQSNEPRDTSLETSITVACGRLGWVQGILDIYNLMLQDAIMPDTITWNALITAAVRAGCPGLSFGFGNAMRRMRASPNVPTFSALLSAAAAMSDAQRAIGLWREMVDDCGLQPDSIACSSYMWACIRGGQPDAAVELYEAWNALGRPPGPPEGVIRGPTFTSLVRGLTKAGRWGQVREAVQVQRWMRSQGFDPDILTLEDVKSLATAEGAHRRWIQAAEVVEAATREAKQIPSQLLGPPDPVSLSFAATAYAHMGQFDRAQVVVDALADAPNLPSTAIAYSTALDACASANAVGPAMRLLQRARSVGVLPDPSAYTSAISAALVDADVGSALKILDLIAEDGRRPTLINCNAAMGVCAAAEDICAMAALYVRMRSEWGLEPDRVLCLTMVEVLAKLGHWTEAAKVLASAAPRHMLVSTKERQRSYWVTQNLFPRLTKSEPDGKKEDELAKCLDIHGLSQLAASLVVRLWLLSIRYDDTLRKAARRGDAAAFEGFFIVTGRGRNSKDGVARLRPYVEELLGKGIGSPSILCITGDPGNRRNPGAVILDPASLCAWMKSPAANLGFGKPGLEKELMEALNSESLPSLDSVMAELRHKLAKAGSAREPRVAGKRGDSPTVEPNPQRTRSGRSRRPARSRWRRRAREAAESLGD